MPKRFLLPAAFLVLTATACCKALCEDEGLRVGFRHFTVAQTDSVLFVRYSPGSPQPLDSQWRRLSVSTLPPDAPSPGLETLLPGSDWQIYLPATDKRYYLTHFDYGEDKCQCTSGRYTTVRAYRLNGTPRPGNYLELQ